ncbi:hypothetical protein AFL01nite_25510 [Aeromicrobium flavum]|uniref:Uncharacterized protein n=1 Tax=Aeromicrobium flavum TaxID=416568 RepID=A0A512HXS1_9ACTN|nr:hypothetical protein [Aeromicrobium flavum]GEO90224.1 hypothetical protein AFL01nite_25510 [Aeromicrobium flavum]
MRIHWNGRGATGRFSIAAEPEAYDATPAVSDFFVDRDMLLLSDDVLSLAAFLAFAPYCSGSLTLPRSVSPELAQAITEFQAPAWVRVANVDMEPRRAPQGSGMALVVDDSLTFEPLPNTWGRARNLAVGVLDSASWAGDLVGTDRLLVASNAHLISQIGPASHAYLPLVATAMLFMESYNCSTLVLPDDAVDAAMWDRLAGLVKAAKFALLRESEARAFLAATTS